MPTAYSPLLGLALPVTGELAGTWGDTVNNYITTYLDSSVAGTQTISGSQTAVTLSVTNGVTLTQVGSGATGSAQYNIINCTGNPASLLTITAPAQSKTYVVVNATSTNQQVKIVGAGPTTGVTLDAGEKAVVAWNGSDFIKVATSAVDGVSTISFGTTGLTPSTATSGAVTVAGTLVAANGGTGQSTYTTGDLLYATGSTTLSKLGIGTNGQILTSTGTAPQWSTLSGVAVTTFSAGTTGFTPSSATSGAVTLAGTLATTNGGTGLTSFTANGVVYASSSSALATGSALTFNGTLQTIASASSGATLELLRLSNTGTGNNTQSQLTFYAASTNYAQITGGYAGAPSLISNVTVGGYHAAQIGGSEYTRLTANLLAVTGAVTSTADSTFSGVVRIGRGGSSVATNTAVGFETLNANTSGTQNTAVGYQTLKSNQTGSWNTALGLVAMNANLSGMYNTGLGYVALSSNNVGSFNTAVGAAALPSSTNASYNTAVGYQAGYNTNSGSSNTAVGTFALYSNTTASNSTAVGYQAGYYQTGGRNTSIGLGAGAGTSASNTTSQSTFIGFNAGTNIQGGSYLVLIGDSAGASNTTGSYNVAIGQNAMVTNQSGTSNIAIGAFALNSNLASNNVAIGYVAGYYNQTGTRNTFIGHQAGRDVLSDYNVFVGSFAGQEVSTGAFNTGVGDACLRNSTTATTGSYNSALGQAALGSLTSGNYNTAIGAGALILSTTASNNTAVGYRAAYNTGAGENTAVGYQSLYSNTTGNLNTALGANALGLNVAGTRSVAVGYNALYNYSATGQTDNVAVGLNAGISLLSGQSNTAVGNYALSSGASGSGSYNTAIGTSALQGNTTANNNTAVGYQAGYSNQTGVNLVALGYGALYGDVSGSNNTAVGFNAGRSEATGGSNTFVGMNAGYYQNGGGANTFVGREAGLNVTTGSYNTFVGAWNSGGNGSGSAMTTGSKNTIIGGYTGNQGGLDIRTASNYIVLSDGDGNPRGIFNNNGAFLAGTTTPSHGTHTFATDANSVRFAFNNNNSTGAYGQIVTYTNQSPNGVGNEFLYCQDSTAVRATIRSNGGIANYQANDVNLSDRREKTNFAPAKDYLDTICAIPVQTFNYIDQSEDDPGLTLGVVAQDVQAVAPELVTESNWGTKDDPKMRLSIYQTDLQYALMKCIQELKSELDSVKAELATLKGA